MKRIIYTLLVCILVNNFNLLAQERNAGAANTSPIEVTYLGFVQPKSDDIELVPQLTHIISKNPSKDETALKEYKEQLVKQPYTDETNKNNTKKTRNFVPVLEAGYNALGNQGTPSDNTIAINKNNQIVCIVNSSLRYYNATTGAGLAASMALSSFFTSPVNGTKQSNVICDPKVVYDHIADKFIVFAQTCEGNSAKSQLLLAFSKSADPTAGWYVYVFSGNPSALVGQNVWFDYPKIGFSNSDVFISGNLFNNNYDYVQSVLYQINKTKCYAGQTLQNNDALIWYNIAGSPFTMVPMSNGAVGGYGNNMYILSTLQSWSGTNIGIYEVTNSTGNNPQMTDNYVNIPNSPAPGLGDQKNTSLKLDLGDNRGMDGFYLNGVLHYVFHCNATGNYSGISYTRLTKSGNNWVVANNKKITIANKDLGFPSICHFGWNNNDRAALIYFNYSSSNDFPGMKAVFVDHNFNDTPPLEVKTGLNYVNTGAQGGEVRWGDYSGLSRDFSANKPTAWCFGMYGATNNGWTNHFAKITTSSWPTETQETIKQESKAINIYPNPIEDIWKMELNLETEGDLLVNLYDLDGRLVREVMSIYAAQGKHLFSFNKGALATGNYILRITLNNRLINNEKISVAR